MLTISYNVNIVNKLYVVLRVKDGVIDFVL